MSGFGLEPGGGVRMQGIMWCTGLRQLGHTVDLVSYWNEYDWKSYDAIIILQMVGQFGEIIRKISMNNPNVIFAPILDPGPNASIARYKFLAKTMSRVKHNIIGRKLRYSSEFIDLYENKDFVKLFFTRSNYETEYVSKCFNVSMSKIRQIPLSLRFEPLKTYPKDKENFCFHASRLASENKNVVRLVEAAKKYGFNLKLAGYLHGELQRQWITQLIGDNNNIEYVGAISDEELKEYYKKAKVFALPSLAEGVGMVAMEAAAYGCEVVITNLGAPKEYFCGLAELVDPFSVDIIGNAIVKCLYQGKSQPKLLDFIKENYSLEACTKLLEKSILELIK